MSAIAKLRVRLWVAAYEIEEARAGHAAGRRYLRSAGCCVALGILMLLMGKS